MKSTEHISQLFDGRGGPSKAMQVKRNIPQLGGNQVETASTKNASVDSIVPAAPARATYQHTLLHLWQEKL